MSGKDDGVYDSPTSWDETSDFIKIKEAKEAQIKKRPKKPTRKKERKNERKREKG